MPWDSVTNGALPPAFGAIGTYRRYRETGDPSARGHAIVKALALDLAPARLLRRNRPRCRTRALNPPFRKVIHATLPLRHYVNWSDE